MIFLGTQATIHVLTTGVAQTPSGRGRGGGLWGRRGCRKKRILQGPSRAVYPVHRFFPWAEVGRFYARTAGSFSAHCRDPQGRISAPSSPRCCHRTFLFVYIVQLRGQGAVGGPKPLRREEVEAMLPPQFANRPRLLKTDLPTDANEGSAS